MLAAQHVMDQVTQALRTAPSPTTSETRQSRRSRVEQPLVLLTRDGDAVTAVRVQVRDVSDGGLGMFRARAMALDEPFIVALPRGDGPPIYVLCSVVYYEPIAEGLFSIGARFIRTLSDPEAKSPAATLNRAALGMNDPFGEEYPTCAA